MARVIDQVGEHQLECSSLLGEAWYRCPCGHGWTYVLPKHMRGSAMARMEHVKDVFLKHVQTVRDRVVPGRCTTSCAVPQMREFN